MTYKLSGGRLSPGQTPNVARPQSRWIPRPRFWLMLEPPERQNGEQEGPRDPRQLKLAFQESMLPVFVRNFM